MTSPPEDGHEPSVDVSEASGAATGPDVANVSDAVPGADAVARADAGLDAGLDAGPDAGSGAAEPLAHAHARGALGPGAERMLRLLAGGFYVTLWGLVVALAFTAAWFLDERAGGVGLVPGWAVSSWCAFTALFLVLAQFGGGSRRGAGRPLDRDDAPGLFEMLDEIGERVGVGSVSAVRLKPAPMMAAARVLRPGRFIVTERRALVIGVPLLRALSVDEMRAAVAHELAHLAGGDVRRGRIVNKASRRIALMRQVLERGKGPARALLTWLNPVWWYLVSYGALLRRGSSTIRRRQEARADALAARVVGAEVYARTLVRVATVGLSFRRLAPGVLLRAAEAEQRIENFFTEFARALADLNATNRKRMARDAVAAHGDESSDHPPLRERLADLGVRSVPSDVDGAPSCATLVPALDAIEREMTPLVVRGLMLGLGDELRRRRERRAAAAHADAPDPETSGSSAGDGELRGPSDAAGPPTQRGDATRA